MSEEKKGSKPVNTAQAAGQLSSSISNVATLPKCLAKMTEALRKGEAPTKSEDSVK